MAFLAWRIVAHLSITKPNPEHDRAVTHVDTCVPDTIHDATHGAAAPPIMIPNMKFVVSVSVYMPGTVSRLRRVADISDARKTHAGS